MDGIIFFNVISYSCLLINIFLPSTFTYIFLYLFLFHDLLFIFKKSSLLINKWFLTAFKRLINKHQLLKNNSFHIIS